MSLRTVSAPTVPQSAATPSNPAGSTAAGTKPALPAGAITTLPHLPGSQTLSTPSQTGALPGSVNTPGSAGALPGGAGGAGGALGAGGSLGTGGEIGSGSGGGLGALMQQVMNSGIGQKLESFISQMIDSPAIKDMIQKIESQVQGAGG